MVPEPWTFALLGLASFRCWWILARDLILDRPRKWLLWRSQEIVADWLDCPFCSGAYIAFAWWGSWYWLSQEWTTVVAVPFALSAVVGVGGALVAHVLDD